MSRTRHRRLARQRWAENRIPDAADHMALNVQSEPMTKSKHAYNSVKLEPELQKVPLNIPYPIPEVFKYQTNIQQPATEVMKTQQAMFVLERVEYPETGGIFAYFEGVPQPAKGFPFPEALYAVNAVKKNIIGLMRSFATKDSLMLALGFLLMRKKTKIRFIERQMDMFATSSFSFLKTSYLKERYYSSFAKELYRFIIHFSVSYGISQDISERFAELIATIFDYDNAYRFRAEDVLSETDKELMMENPAKELKRILAILTEREPAKYNNDKFALVGTILKYMFWIPSFRVAFYDALEQCDFQNFQLDDADRYHILLWADYNFLGKTIEDRVKIYEAVHKEGLPRRIIYTPANP